MGRLYFAAVVTALLLWAVSVIVLKKRKELPVIWAAVYLFFLVFNTALVLLPVVLKFAGFRPVLNLLLSIPVSAVIAAGFFIIYKKAAEGREN